MNFIKRVGLPYLVLFCVCVVIIAVAEYVFLNGDQLDGIFIGLWAPMVMGIMIFLKLVENGRK